MIPFVIIILFLFMFLGFPVFLSIGFGTLIQYFQQGSQAMTTFMLQAFRGVSGYQFIAIPLFMFAGNIMNKTGITKRLLDFAGVFVGSFRGGLAQINVLGSILFAGISGSALADTAALGSILIPAMEDAGYERGFAGAITAASSIVGPVIAPSIVLVIYGATFQVSIGGLFAAALIPGFTIGISQMIITYIISVKKDYPRDERVTINEGFIRTKKAIIPLIMPFIIVGGIFSGVFTATEASAVAVAYGLFVGFFVLRSLSIKVVLEEALNSVFTASGILIVLAAAAQLSFLLGRRRIPILVMEALLDLTGNVVVLLILVNIILFIMGMFMDRTVSIFLLGPILIPALEGLGLSELHIGMIIIFGLGIGHITPPVGPALFTTSYVGKMPMEEMLPFVGPYIVGLVILSFIVTFVPGFVEFLPSMLGFM